MSIPPPDIATSRPANLPQSSAAGVKAAWPRYLAASLFVLTLGGIVALIPVSPVVLCGVVLLGVVLLACREFYRLRVRRRWKVVMLACVPLAGAVALGLRTHFRYQTAAVMQVPLREFTNAEYPEDPASRSIHYGEYEGRRLVLRQNDATHFDFILEPNQPHIAQVVFRNVDVSLMTPGLPEWTREDGGLRRIALTDRQWNRQQVRFDPAGPHIAVTGGDGFEKNHLFSAELAKNCLNAGLWEVLLFTNDGNGKALYYHGWFTFPLGHYKNLFEHNTGLSYWNHWYYLEHWFDPAGTPVPLNQLRRVIAERAAPTTFNPAEKTLAAGEQVNKRRTTLAENVVSWGDFHDGRKVRFASFIPPGRYSVSHPWNNQYGRMDRFEKAIWREVVSPATGKPLHELELILRGSRQAGVCRFVVSGFDLQALPQLPMRDYPQGLYMPMGIGVPPFFQNYDQLQQQPPPQSPYVSLLLDADNRWIDHHSFGIDGPVMHRDEQDANVLHVYLLSYERHSLVGHFVVSPGVP